MVAPFDAAEFRRTLGCLPTGVAVITTTGPSGAPVGMAANSFMSVSLDPPLVMLCVAHESATLVDLRRSGTFCANVLAAEQAPLCQRFSLKGVDRFAGVPWTPSAAGPQLDDALARVSCSLQTEHVAGDHVILVARVTALAVHPDEPAPLVFHRGRLGGFREEPKPSARTWSPHRQGVGGSAWVSLAAG
ncbi:flavin reductase family protein [Streptomyces sp. PmtG]